MVEESFSYWRSEKLPEDKEELQLPKTGIFIDKKGDINSSKFKLFSL